MYASSGTSNQPMYYEQALLKESPPVVVAHQVRPYYAQPIAYVVPEEPKKRYMCGGVCCALCCAIFLVLLFFVPRPPRAVLQSSVVTVYPTTLTYTVTQSIEVYNGNFYSLSLSDLDGTVTSDFLVGGEYLQGNGVFVGDQNIVIDRTSTKTIEILYTFENVTQGAFVDTAQQCQLQEGASYTTEGSLNMQTWYKNFHGVEYGPWIVTYTCT